VFPDLALFGNRATNSWFLEVVLIEGLVVALDRVPHQGGLDGTTTIICLRNVPVAILHPPLR
jgi:hypothetical protein